MDRLELIVFHVGHGLSVALIEKPENYVTLVDLGASSGFTPLKELGLRFKVKPDILYITHPHADHLDDVETALDRIFAPLGIHFQDYDWSDVKKRERKELSYKIDEYRELIASLPHRAYSGGAHLKSWAYTPENAKKNFGESSYINNSSLLLIYTWKGFKVTITGDLETVAIDRMLTEAPVLADVKNTDLLIAPHHGHKSGFPNTWVQTVGKPYLTLVSANESDPHIDKQYDSPKFAHGLTLNGHPQYMISTGDSGSIHLTVTFGNNGSQNWNFEYF